MSLGTVVFVTPHFLPHLGGVEQYVGRLATALLQRGRIRRAVIVTTTADAVAPSPRAQLPAGGGATVHVLPALTAASKTPLGLGWAAGLRTVLAAERPDVVNAHAPVPLLADVAARVVGSRPFVLTYHTGPMRKGVPGLDLALRTYERQVLRRTAARADRVICGSRYVAASMRDVLGADTTVITAGVDLTRFAPIGPPPPGRILFVGSLYRATAYKGLDTLLAATALLRSRGTVAHLDVVGGGDALPAYVAQARQLGLDADVTFHGALDGDDVARAYGRATVVALPSAFDSVPTALVEAMACARPVVSTRVGGIPELVEDGSTGLLVPPGDPAELADALARVLADPSFARDAGQRGRRLVTDRFDADLLADRTADVFAQAVAARPAPSVPPAPPGPSAPSSPGRGDRPVRVAVVTPYYPPHTGGVERYTERVAGMLRDRRDLEGVVVTSRPGVRTRTEERDGVTVVRIGAWARLSNTPVSPLWPWTVRRLLHRHRIDVLNVHSPVPYLADVATWVAGRRPVVLTYHAGSLVKGQHLLDPALAWYERHALAALFRRVDALIAVSPASLAWATRRAEIITPGVDAEQFRPPAGDGPRQPVLLFVGRLERSSAWKGVDVLLRALPAVLAAVPGTRLELVGDGDARPALAALADRLGVADRVRFRGHLHGDALAAAFARAAVTVLPSTTAAESFGMVLVEAMASATPVVASRVGGVPFVVRDGVEGLLVDPGRPDLLAAACVRILTDPQLAVDLGRRGRLTAAQRFSWSAQLERTAQVLLAAARGGSGTALPVTSAAPAPEQSAHGEADRAEQPRPDPPRAVAQ